MQKEQELTGKKAEPDDLLSPTKSKKKKFLGGGPCERECCLNQMPKTFVETGVQVFIMDKKKKEKPPTIVMPSRKVTDISAMSPSKRVTPISQSPEPTMPSEDEDDLM